MLDQAKLYELATAIAALLPGSWRFHRLESEQWSHHNPHAVISNDDAKDKALLLALDWPNNARLAITGRLRRTEHCYGGSTRKITVNPDRGVIAITGDIKRRLLPEYEEAFAKRQAEITEGVARTKLFAQKIALLRRICPDFYDYKYNDRFSFKLPIGDERARLEMSRFYGGVKMEFSLPFDEIVRVIGFLNGLGKRE